MLDDSDSAWAHQLIAGVRVPVSSNIDAGLKYRYFRTNRLNFRDNVNFTDAGVLLGSDSRFSSHSLLASLIFNFGAPAAAPIIPAAAPPPPPPPPATRTCPDGRVVLATEMCPAPPPPPPPPPPMPERG
jgi:OmpA-OmpF porin, OOP family